MPSSQRPINKPLAWFGHDRLLLDDVTDYGLRRRVLARKDDIPDMLVHLNLAYREAGMAKVNHYLVQKDDGVFYLWIVWKLT